VGGVTVCVLPLSADQLARGANNLADDYSGWQGQVGENHLNGMQALAFVRQRHGLPRGDFDRINRQQHFLGALFRQAASTETLTNPATLKALLDATTEALTLDEDTSLADLQRLAVRMQGVSTGGVRLQTVSTKTQIQDSGASTEVYDPAELDALLAEITGRQPSSGAASSGAAPTGAASAPAAASPVAAAGLFPAWPMPVAARPIAAGAGTTTTGGSGEPSPASCVY
jgi:anionic cell wall polymer biosynthesis LytR-Cps2A-Psr (LCP) family protein